MNEKLKQIKGSNATLSQTKTSNTKVSQNKMLQDSADAEHTLVNGSHRINTKYRVWQRVSYYTKDETTAATPTVCFTAPQVQISSS